MLSFASSGRPIRVLTASVFATAFIAAVGSTLLPASALAQSRAKIYVLPYQPVNGGAPAEVGKQTTEIVKSELANLAEVELVTSEAGDYEPTEGAQEPATLSGPQRDAELASAADLAARAKAAYDTAADLNRKTGKADFRQAITLYNQAIAEYRKTFDALTDFGRLTDIYLQLAICNYRSGDPEKGDQNLTNLVRLNPGFELDETKFPPPFVQQFKELRKKVMTAQRGSIAVESDPAGSKVVLNGRELGSTPLRINELIRGEHYIRIEAPDGKVAVASVTVSPGREEAVRISTTGTKSVAAGPEGKVYEKLKANKIDSQARADLAAIGKKVGAGYVMFGGVAEIRGNYQVHSYLLQVDQGLMTDVTPLTFDVDLLQASLEALKLSEDMKKRLVSFGTPLRDPVVPVIPGFESKATEGAPMPAVIGQPAWGEQIVSAPVAVVAPMGEVAPAPAPAPGYGQQPPPGYGQQPAPGFTPPPPAPAPRANTGGVFSQLNAPSTNAAPEEVSDIEYVPVYKKWWFWTIIGAVAVAGGTTAYFLAKPGISDQAAANIVIK